MDVALTSGLLAVASTGLLCLGVGWVGASDGKVPEGRAEGIGLAATKRAIERLGLPAWLGMSPEKERREWLSDTRRAIKLPAMREVLETPTQGT